MWKKKTALASFIVLFILLTALAIYYESTKFLYAASFIPILIVLLLPDMKSAQYVVPGKEKGKFALYKTGEPGEELITLSFEPGFVLWYKKTLYFRVDDLQTAAPPSVSQSVSAALSVLRFDLVAHPRKSGWIGIRLNNLKERTAGLSYTTEEVNRIVFSAADLADVIQPQKSVAAAQNRGVQA